MKLISLLLLCLSCATYHSSFKNINLNDCVKVEGVNDPLAEFIKISSESCHQFKQGLLKLVWNDIYLLGLFHKKNPGNNVITIRHQSTSENRTPYLNSTSFGIDLRSFSSNFIDSRIKCESNRCIHTSYHNTPLKINDLEHLKTSINGNKLILRENFKNIKNRDQLIEKLEVEQFITKFKKYSKERENKE